MNRVEFLGWVLERDRELAMKCIEKGARTYLVKPIHPDFLRRALHDGLAVRSVLMERNRLMESD